MKGSSVHISHLLSLRKEHIEGRMITVFLVFCPNTKLFFHFIPCMYNFTDIQKFTSLWGKKRNTFLPGNVSLFKGKIVREMNIFFYHIVRKGIF